MQYVGGPEILLFVFLPLMILWVIGVVRLFRNGHQTLGIVALIGMVVPLLGLVGYAGWFLGPKDAPSPGPADGGPADGPGEPPPTGPVTRDRW